MRLTEIHDGIPTAAALRESTRIQRHGGKMAISSILTVGLARQKCRL